MTRRSKVLGGVLLALVLVVASLALAMSHNSPCSSPPAVPPGAQSMQAIVYRCYGSPDVMRLATVAKPVPGDHGVLIKVHAASVNPIDWHELEGKPYLVRTSTGWGAPHDTRLGTDFAGTVEAVGKDVTRFKPGDEVFGGADGSFAEYLTLPENRAVALKPANLTFEEAAAVPVTALTALQALRDHGKLRSGQKVLINGAGGGVGTFAVQIAKALGADVTGVTSTANLALVRSLGADHVVDYKRQDFTRQGQRYDLIVDLGGGHSLRDYRRAMTPKGIYVMVGKQHIGQWIDPLVSFIEPAVMSRFVSQQFVTFLARLDKADLLTVRDLIQAGKVRPVVDRSYPLGKTADAFRYAETGHARGKVVISID